MSDSESNGEWQFPRIHNGMIVDVDSDRAFTRPILGWIHQKKTNSARILVFPAQGAPRVISDCRHKDDPRLQTMPNWVTENPRDRALFALNEVEFERAKTRDSLAALRTIVEQQAAQIAVLQAQIEDAGAIGDETIPRRGRKPKPQLVEA